MQKNLSFSYLCNNNKMKDSINIVWLKRDLRTTDHIPLYEAEKKQQNYIIIYLFEPNQTNYDDYSLRHKQFIYHSIIEMNKLLKKYNREVIIFNENADVVFDYLTSKYDVINVISYQESGTKNSWLRDKKVKLLLKKNKTKWLEFEKQAVIRGKKNRNGWDKYWYSYANSEIINNNYSINDYKYEKTPFDFSIKKNKELEEYPSQFQPAGEKYALKYLDSFISSRGKNYNIHISQPEKSRYSCGRLSTYLSWGNISVKQVYQKVKNSSNYKLNKRAFNSFLARLKWRSHFIQKFEVDCSYEYTCINRGYEKMEFENNDYLLESWKSGNTGFPLVDASMKCLINNGWLNFRMRAMLVSFLCHYLNQDWKRGVYHLAQLFLDYEPGIHYTQFQMQAGVTGINSIRVYNPIKQSKENDTDGVFIKKWIPELSKIDHKIIHEPWILTDIDLNGNVIPQIYRKPIISTDFKNSSVRKKLWSLRKDSFVKEESKRILNIHVRKKTSK